jgi:hypothetical protein
MKPAGWPPAPTIVIVAQGRHSNAFLIPSAVGLPRVAVRQKLAELGFHWNNVRQTWQHPCGTPALDGTDYDPRRRYASFAAVAMFR